MAKTKDYICPCCESTLVFGEVDDTVKIIRFKPSDKIKKLAEEPDTKNDDDKTSDKTDVSFFKRLFQGDDEDGFITIK